MEHGQILRSLRETGDYSDLTITCGPQTFKVHKCVVCLRSTWFAAVCQEERWKEGKEGLIELKAVESCGVDEDFSCDDPEAVACMLDFIYLGDYHLNKADVVATTSSGSVTSNTPIHEHRQDLDLIEDSPFIGTSSNGFKQKRSKKYKPDPWGAFGGSATPEPEPGPEPVIGASTGIAQPKGSLTMHTRLYALGVKYNLNHLKKVAVLKMQMAVRGTWDREDFAKAIAVAFGATSDDDMGMRDIIMWTILSCSANLVTDPVVEKAINAVDGLPYELFKRQSTSAKRKGY